MIRPRTPSAPASWPSPHTRGDDPHVDQVHNASGTWDSIVEPKDDGLQATVDLIKQNVDAGLDTYVNVNNHYEGCAPLTIQRLLRILERGTSK